MFRPSPANTPKKLDVASPHPSPCKRVVRSLALTSTSTISHPGDPIQNATWVPTSGSVLLSNNDPVTFQGPAEEMREVALVRSGLERERFARAFSQIEALIPDIQEKSVFCTAPLCTPEVLAYLTRSPKTAARRLVHLRGLFRDADFIDLLLHQPAALLTDFHFISYVSKALPAFSRSATHPAACSPFVEGQPLALKEATLIAEARRMAALAPRDFVTRLQWYLKEMPSLLRSLPVMDASIVAWLVDEQEVVVQRCGALRKLFPAADVASLVGRAPAVALDDRLFGSMRDRKVHLQALFGGLSIDRLAELDPSFLGATSVEAIGDPDLRREIQANPGAILGSFVEALETNGRPVNMGASAFGLGSWDGEGCTWVGTERYRSGQVATDRIHSPSAKFKKRERRRKILSDTSDTIEIEEPDHAAQEAEATWAQSEGLEAARQLSGLSEDAFQQALSQLEAVLPNLRDRSTVWSTALCAPETLGTLVQSPRTAARRMVDLRALFPSIDIVEFALQNPVLLLEAFPAAYACSKALLVNPEDGPASPFRCYRLLNLNEALLLAESCRLTGLDPEDYARRLGDLYRSVPEAMQWFLSPDPAVIAWMIEGSDKIAERWGPLKALFPGADMAKMVAKSPALILDDTLYAALEPRRGLLREAFGGLDIDRLVEADPSFLGLASLDAVPYELRQELRSGPDSLMAAFMDALERSAGRLVTLGSNALQLGVWEGEARTMDALHAYNSGAVASRRAAAAAPHPAAGEERPESPSGKWGQLRTPADSDASSQPAPVAHVAVEAALDAPTYSISEPLAPEAPAPKNALATGKAVKVREVRGRAIKPMPEVDAPSTYSDVGPQDTPSEEALTTASAPSAAAAASRPASPSKWAVLRGSSPAAPEETRSASPPPASRPDSPSKWAALRQHMAVASVGVTVDVAIEDSSSSDGASAQLASAPVSALPVAIEAAPSASESVGIEAAAVEPSAVETPFMEVISQAAAAAVNAYGPSNDILTTNISGQALEALMAAEATLAAAEPAAPTIPAPTTTPEVPTEAVVLAEAAATPSLEIPSEPAVIVPEPATAIASVAVDLLETSLDASLASEADEEADTLGSAAVDAATEAPSSVPETSSKAEERESEAVKEAAALIDEPASPISLVAASDVLLPLSAPGDNAESCDLPQASSTAVAESSAPEPLIATTEDVAGMLGAGLEEALEAAKATDAPAAVAAFTPVISLSHATPLLQGSGPESKAAAKDLDALLVAAAASASQPSAPAQVAASIIPPALEVQVGSSTAALKEPKAAKASPSTPAAAASTTKASAGFGKASGKAAGSKASVGKRDKSDKHATAGAPSGSGARREGKGKFKDVDGDGCSMQ